jgi:phosphoglycerate dehydrogenase-like enzyme
VIELENVAVIGRAGVGVDNIDVERDLPRGGRSMPRR